MMSERRLRDPRRALIFTPRRYTFISWFNCRSGPERRSSLAVAAVRAAAGRFDHTLRLAREEADGGHGGKDERGPSSSRHREAHLVDALVRRMAATI